jgi:hypothetical protein
LSWHQGGTVEDEITLEVYRRSLAQSKSGKRDDHQAFDEIMQDLQVDVEAANDLVDLHLLFLNKMKKGHATELAKIKKSKNPLDIVHLARRDLITAYHEGKLSAQKKSAVEKIVRVCCRPSECANKMRTFAVEIAKAWNASDQQNLEAIAELCSKTFYGETNIHPYFNCNGRTATCLVNIICRSLNHASILMRKPGEKEDPSSNYSQVIKMIDSEPERLRMHFFKIIQEADQSYGYSNDDLRKVVEWRFRTVRQFVQFNNVFPKIDLNAWMLKEQDNVSAVMDLICEDKGIDCDSLSEDQQGSMMSEIYLAKLEGYQKECRANVPSLSVVSSMQKQYTLEEKGVIRQKLEWLTGLSGWKTNTENGLKLFLEVESEQRALELAGVLRETKTMDANNRIVAKTNRSLVLIENVHVERLLAVNELIGWKKADMGPGQRQKAAFPG